MLKKISPLPMMSSTSNKAQTYATGTKVEAKVKGWKSFYKGTITGYDAANGTYSVEFEDGDKKDGVKGFNIRPLVASQTFTAPDGKTFQDRSQYRKYVSDTFYSFRDRKNETLVKKEGEICGQSFTISGLDKCEVQLMDHSDQVLLDGISGCKILIGPSSESVFVRNAKNCHFFIACKQFRCRDCESCTVSLYSKTEPVVETSSKMRFYPYSASYSNQTAHFSKAKLIPEHNHWCNVFDFNKGDNRYPEPHWELIPEPEGWPEWKLGDEATAENPVPKTARAIVMPKESGFAISVSQEEAQMAFNAAATQDAPAEQSQLPSAPAAPVPPSNVTSQQALPSETTSAGNTEISPLASDANESKPTETEATSASSLEQSIKEDISQQTKEE